MVVNLGDILIIQNFRFTNIQTAEVLSFFFHMWGREVNEKEFPPLLWYCCIFPLVLFSFLIMRLWNSFFLQLWFWLLECYNWSYNSPAIRSFYNSDFLKCWLHWSWNPVRGLVIRRLKPQDLVWLYKVL